MVGCMAIVKGERSLFRKKLRKNFWERVGLDIVTAIPCAQTDEQSKT